MIETINLDEKLSLFDAHWEPRVIAALNGQEVKVAKLLGEFVWHAHAEADELFLVLRGHLEMQFRDRTVNVSEGEMIVVPRGVDHRPRAPREAHVLLFEPAGTLNTGDAGGERTVRRPERI